VDPWLQVLRAGIARKVLRTVVIQPAQIRGGRFDAVRAEPVFHAA
jgi:hypothetical protein